MDMGGARRHDFNLQQFRPATSSMPSMSNSEERGMIYDFNCEKKKSIRNLFDCMEIYEEDELTQSAKC
jgi:hypothetical protein